MSAPRPTAVTQPPTIDVSDLPPYAFGHRSLLWWGGAGIIVIESMVFALGIAAYFYLRGREQDWPPGILAPPRLLWGTLNLGILLLSCIPNYLYKRAAEHLDLRAVRRWFVVAIGFAVAFVAVRVLEFGALNCHWSTTAYGSVVYLILGLHTVHLVTDLLDSLVLAVLMFTRQVEGRRFVDVAENGAYWYFVAAAGVPLYLTIYWAPRLL
jgi:heme/copper-type cytochrome/quinol oxidase subunit 3